MVEFLRPSFFELLPNAGIKHEANDGEHPAVGNRDRLGLKGRADYRRVRTRYDHVRARFQMDGELTSRIRLKLRNASAVLLDGERRAERRIARHIHATDRRHRPAHHDAREACRARGRRSCRGARDDRGSNDDQDNA